MNDEKITSSLLRKINEIRKSSDVPSDPLWVAKLRKFFLISYGVTLLVVIPLLWLKFFQLGLILFCLGQVVSLVFMFAYFLAPLYIRLRDRKKRGFVPDLQFRIDKDEQAIATLLGYSPTVLSLMSVHLEREIKRLEARGKTGTILIGIVPSIFYVFNKGRDLFSGNILHGITAIQGWLVEGNFFLFAVALLSGLLIGKVFVSAHLEGLFRVNFIVTQAALRMERNDGSQMF
ncbi:hypothetical protein [Chitiniphilus eburneus]|uniref:Uncharacterized protein n=1 Tax=Chitiniphilus eburneus TaxID=2571148 RepID=A0A4U0Q051_9NEIS|nr:hypothetical protein [Chitiniphilus eburneus]TJZ74277.1 hypothetical protein FAZ21_08305 [Chitiniphilus eburneus]